MATNKTSGLSIERSIARSTRFEVSIADLARRSEQRAWRIAWCAIAVAMIVSGGYYFLLPLKQNVPFLVMADAFTGTATVARLDGDFAMRGVTTREAVNRSNVAHFVLARESYDLGLADLGDWKTVQTMAAPGVKTPYVQLYSTNNPDSLVKQYGKDQAIRVKLLSIQLIGGGQGKTPVGATVRFQRSLFQKQTGASRPMDNKIATMAFTYKQNLAMDDRSRIENPLGFWVTSYRVDDDYATPAPPEFPAASAAQSPAPQEAAAAGTTPGPEDIASASAMATGSTHGAGSR